MASLTVRKLDDNVKRQLRRQAAEHGRSLEAEVREILGAGIEKPGAMRETGADLFDAIHRRFAPFGGIDLKLPKRGRLRKPPDFTR